MPSHLFPGNRRLNAGKIKKLKKKKSSTEYLKEIQSSSTFYGREHCAAWQTQLNLVQI